MPTRLMLILASLFVAVNTSVAQDEAWPKTAAEAASLLGTGINLGNMLEAPNEGDWGARFEDDYAAIIRKAGFQHVRLPVKWSAHAGRTAPFTIESALIDRVKHIVSVCLKNDLRVVLNLHHYDEIHDDPPAQEERFVALWAQISEHFADQPATITFELLNEPHGKFTTASWNAMFPKALKHVRERNPHRPVIIGPAVWNSFSELPKLSLPDDDRMIIATFHYYLPFEFTHQAADFLGKDMPPGGRAFPKDPKEPHMMAEHFQKVADWSKKSGRPIYLGEFGSFHKAAMDDRIRWTREVVGLARKHGFSTAYWEFCSGFGAFDPEAKEWRAPLKDAIFISTGRR